MKTDVKLSHVIKQAQIESQQSVLSCQFKSIKKVEPEAYSLASSLHSLSTQKRQSTNTAFKMFVAKRPRANTSLRIEKAVLENLTRLPIEAILRFASMFQRANRWTDLI